MTRKGFRTPVNLRATLDAVIQRLGYENTEMITDMLKEKKATHFALYECHVRGSKDIGQRFGVIVAPGEKVPTLEYLSVQDRLGGDGDLADLVMLAVVPGESDDDSRDVPSQTQARRVAPPDRHVAPTKVDQ